MNKESQSSGPSLVKQPNTSEDKCNQTQTVCVPWQNQKILVADNLKQCQAALKKLQACCKQYGVLGIGCNFSKNACDKLSLLMLSTFDGLSVLIRLKRNAHHKVFLDELKEILEDASIVKVGVNLVNVCMKLINYDIFVASILDLRYLATKCNFHPGSMSVLSTKHLGVELWQNNRLDNERWFKRKISEIDENDKKYAAIYVRAAIELFKVFKNALTASDSTDDVHKFINDHCSVYLNKFYKNQKPTENPEVVKVVQNRVELPAQRVELITSVEQFDDVIQLLKEHCNKYKIIGFCCQKYRRTAVAVGLASLHGLCVFVQLRRNPVISQEIRKILEDKSIVKVGVNIYSDSDRLEGDYGFAVASILDLRHIAKDCAYQPDDLGRLSQEHLGIDLEEDDWRLSLTDWRAPNINNFGLNNAAKRIQASVELLKLFKQKLVNDESWLKFIADNCQKYLNDDYPKRKVQNLTGTLPEQDIRVVSTAHECKMVVQEIYRHCKEYNVLGFDCESLPFGRNKVSLLQLATHRGLCALIRLCTMKKVPNELRELMEDERILKVGVDPHQDAKKLQHNHIVVKNTLDLVPLAKICQYQGAGIQSLSEEVLNVQLANKKRGLMLMKLYKKWEYNILPRENIEYAANDVHVSIELFKKFEEKLMNNEVASDGNRLGVQMFIDKFCLPHLQNK